VVPPAGARFPVGVTYAGSVPACPPPASSPSPLLLPPRPRRRRRAARCPLSCAAASSCVRLLLRPPPPYDADGGGDRPARAPLPVPLVALSLPPPPGVDFACCAGCAARRIARYLLAAPSAPPGPRPHQSRVPWPPAGDPPQHLPTAAAAATVSGVRVCFRERVGAVRNEAARVAPRLKRGRVDVLKLLRWWRC
jgi:hypothetical protein